MIMADNTVARYPMTRAGFDKLRQELEQLKTIERPKITDEVETARAHGDLSENAEYHAAREKLGQIQGRIMDIDARISRAEIIDPTNFIGQSKVMFGAYVTVLDVEEEKETTYQIVGEHESDIAKGKISVTSPIARAMIGKLKSSPFVLKTPKGSKDYEIVEVEYK
jgi:transcription elongation factor GreA